MATRTLCAVTLAAVCLGLLTTPATAAGNASDPQRLELPYTVRFSDEAFTFDKLEGYDLVGLRDGGHLDATGTPSLPAKTIRIALPVGMAVTGVRVTAAESVGVAGQYKVYPAQLPRPIADRRDDHAFVAPDPLTYASAEPCPGKLVELVGQTDLAGQGIAAVCLYPVQDVPATGELTLYTSISILLEGTDGYECGDYLPAHASGHVREAYRQTVRDMVVNPEDVALTLAPATPLKSRGVGPGEFEYVIITHSIWMDDFQPLADWRTCQGIPTTIVPTSWIYNDGGYAGTNLEKIRAFVVDAHDSWGATHFLLGADTDIIPDHIRTITVPTYGTDDIPNDTYYADYDEDWVCEVHVGRAPVRMAAHISTFIDKVFTYEKNPPPDDYITAAAFFGFDITDPGDQDGEIAKENIRSLHLPASWTINTEYDSEPGTHRADVIGYLNQGHHLVNHHDHCNANCMGTGWISHGELLYTADASALVNGDRLSILFAVGCNPCDVSVPTAISEAFIQNPNGGAIAFMGNSRTGWGGGPGDPDYYSVRQDRFFYRNLLDDGFERLGDNFSDLKNDEFDFDDPYNLHQYCFTQLHLLGDPELFLWSDEPQNLSVICDEAVPASGPATFPVEVLSSGSPVDNATVCLWKPGDVYEVEHTDPSGLATFELAPSTTGSMHLTVTGHNYLPYEDDVEVVDIPPCAALTARSCRDHGPAGRLCLEVGTSGGIEPRLGGISEVEIDLDDASGFSGGVDVNCSAIWTGTANATLADTTVTVTLDPALPNRAWCTIELDCGAQVCLRALAGDVDRNGTVTTGDASIIKPRFGDTPDEATCAYDCDASGLITTADFSQIKPTFGNTAPACP